MNLLLLYNLKHINIDMDLVMFVIYNLFMYHIYIYYFNLSLLNILLYHIMGIHINKIIKFTELQRHVLYVVSDKSRPFKLLPFI